MQPLLSPDKLLHGYSSLTACQLPLPRPQISARYHCTHTHSHTHASVSSFAQRFGLFVSLLSYSVIVVYFYHCYYLHGLFLKLYPFCSKQMDHIMSVRDCLSVQVFATVYLCWYVGMESECRKCFCNPLCQCKTRLLCKRRLLPLRWEIFHWCLKTPTKPS